MKQIALANLFVVSAIILVLSMREATRRVNQSNEASTVAVESMCSSGDALNGVVPGTGITTTYGAGICAVSRTAEGSFLKPVFTRRTTLQTPGTELTRADFAKSVFNLVNAYRKIAIHVC
jgi:hypothetical protein